MQLFSEDSLIFTGNPTYFSYLFIKISQQLCVLQFRIWICCLLCKQCKLRVVTAAPFTRNSQNTPSVFVVSLFWQILLLKMLRSEISYVALPFKMLLSLIFFDLTVRCKSTRQTKIAFLDYRPMRRAVPAQWGVFSCPRTNQFEGAFLKAFQVNFRGNFKDVSHQTINF